MKVAVPHEAAHCAEAYAAAYTEAALEERARCKAIITGPTGAARPKMALALAMNTEMTPAEAEAFMASLPAEGPTVRMVASPIMGNDPAGIVGEIP